MKAVKTAIASVVAVGLLGGTALAADMPAYTPEPAPAPAPAPVYDNSGWYLRGDLGWSWTDMGGHLENDDDFTAGGGVGYRFNDMFRADITGDYSGKYDMGPGKYDAWTLLGNGYVDIPWGSTVTPYVGAGLGWGWLNGSNGLDDDDGFTFALMGGVAFNITERVALDVGYRYRNTSIDGPNFQDHSARAGLRFSF